MREIEDRLVKRFSDLRSQGLNLSFQMILASLDIDGLTSIYEFDESGLSEPMHDNPGYAIIGSGMVTGGVLLLRMLGYDPDLDLGLVSGFIIDSVSDISTSVGPFIGESYFMRIESQDGQKKILLGQLKPEALTEYKDQIKIRRNLIRRLWRDCDDHGEAKIQALLDSLGQQSETKSEDK